MNADRKTCPKCASSGRPGYVMFATYYDRMEPTDVIGEYRMTSGKEYARCFWCSGAGEVGADDRPLTTP